MRVPNAATHSSNDTDARCLDELEAFLDSAQVAPDCIQLPELAGLLAAVALSPRPVRPEQWLGRIWGGHAPRFESTDQAQRLMQVMRARHD
jgi:yecA family protein